MTRLHRKLESCFTSITAAVYKYKFIAFGMMVLITAALASQLPKLTIDTRDESFFHDDDPTLIAYNKFRDQFGQDDMFFIALAPERGLTPEFLTLLDQFHAELEEKTPYLDDITSIVNGRVVRAEGDTLNVEDLMPDPPETRSEFDRILALIDHYPMFENMLVSSDRSLAVILIKAQAVIAASEEDILAGFDEAASSEPDTKSKYLSNDQNVEIDTVIRSVVNRYRDRGVDFYLGGTPVFVAEIQRGIEKDLGLMIPLSFLIITLFLAVLFRRISGVIYPLIIVFTSLVSTLGIMAIWSIPITNAIQILPTFLIVVGIGDSVHILTIFYRQFKITHDKRQAIIQAMGYAGLPVLMTSITTACGLLSFIWADVAVIAQLGYVAPVGVMLAFFYTLVLLPALIGIFPVKAPRKVAASGGASLPDRLFDGITRLTTKHPYGVVAFSAVLVLLSIISSMNVRFSHNAMTWLPEDSFARLSTEILDSRNGGTIMLEVIIDSGKRNGLYDPDLLMRMNQAADAISNISVHGIKAGKVMSIADMVKEINRALHEDSNDAYIIPDNRELIAQELILFESSGSDDLEDVTNGTYQIGRLSILAPFTDSVLYKDYTDKIEAFLRTQFPEETVSLTGHMALFIGITKRFINSMAKSYVFALVIITILMVIMIGRVRIGLMSMIANVIPIIMIFGIMGVLDIPLDMATILIGSLVLGLWWMTPSISCTIFGGALKKNTMWQQQ